MSRTTNTGLIFYHRMSSSGLEILHCTVTEKDHIFVETRIFYVYKASSCEV